MVARTTTLVRVSPSPNINWDSIYVAFPVSETGDLHVVPARFNVLARVWPSKYAESFPDFDTGIFSFRSWAREVQGVQTN